MKITRTMRLSVLLLALAAIPRELASQEPKERPTRTKMVLLGTGTPVPDPDRSGPATAIVVDDSAYLVDFGPGVVRRAEAAVLSRGITAIEPGNLKVAFVTDLRSDHTAGYFGSHLHRMDRWPACTASNVRSGRTAIDDRAHSAGLSD